MSKIAQFSERNIRHNYYKKIFEDQDRSLEDNDRSLKKTLNDIITNT